jgi:hypothetical protein
MGLFDVVVVRVETCGKRGDGDHAAQDKQELHRVSTAMVLLCRQYPAPTHADDRRRVGSLNFAP